ncbi:MAG TPA: serine hydrolase domain-containing protein, partial [Candidatus Berkiella sp.]|nr:serine hydrolase domain-containing protein [Candidatus Berkiella sp.]
MVKLTSKLFLFGTLLCSFVACAAPSADKTVAEILPTLEKNIAQTMKANDIPGVAVAIVSKDKIYYMKGFGVKKVGQTDKVTSTTLFQIGSLSKPVHATLLAILQDQGKLSLQDPVHQYIPHFKVSNAKQPVKICHLMSHSTGVPNNGFNERIEAFAPRENIVAKLQKTPVVAQPGKNFVYHNAMYGVVEDVVNSACGKRLETVINKELFTPLGMQHASLGYESMLVASDKAYPHIPNGRGKYMPAQKYSTSYYAFPAAGGINASVQDLAPFLQLYLGKPSTIVSKSTLAQLTQ